MTRSGMPVIALIILALVVTACGDTPPPTDTDTSEAPAASVDVAESTAPTESEPPADTTDNRLATVQERGELICGVNGELTGFSFIDAEGNTVGFDADFCRAIAAAVLGDSEAVDFRPLSADQRSTALQTGEVDVLIRNTTWTVNRDTLWGLFAPTTFYDGQAIMVDSSVVDATSVEDLDGADVCVLQGTTTVLNLEDAARTAGVTLNAQQFESADDMYPVYEAGECDAVTSDRSQLTAIRTTLENPDDHVIFEDVLSKEPLGPVVPFGDEQWFNVVKWVVYATIEAEELGLTSDNVEEMATTSENPVVLRLLGVEPVETALGLEPDWAVTMISQVGNYAEIFDRNLGPDTAINLDRGVNSLWTDGGLLYAPPYR
jgi:general L-amino acid transport system substrate-binding protein